MFEKASRIKLRFSPMRGGLTVEDLWDLPLQSEKNISLDMIAKSINKHLKETAEESFVEEKSSANSILELSLNIIKHIISVRKTENKTATDAVAIRHGNAEIDEIIRKKKSENLQSKTIEELEALKK